MEINIDFLVAGCNTRCKHCYVNGGPGPLMPTGDALLCVEKLDEMARYLPEGTSLTLDHEPMNHPGLPQILRAVSRAENIVNYHHGMTTGVGLMCRKDKEAVVQSYLENGYHNFGITIHGAAAHHDEITRRRGSYDASVAAAKFLMDMGGRVEVSLMMNRFFAEDADAISRLVDELGTENIWFAIPIFTPHSNGLAFEPYRAALDVFEEIQEHLCRWHQNARDLLETARGNTIGAAAERLRGMDLRQLWQTEQTELYLTLHQDCKLYVGNSGSETRCLGDLRALDIQETAEIICALPGNRDYGAFYDIMDLPSTEAVCQALEAMPRNLVYGDFESVLYRALAGLHVPTKIL